MQAVPAGEPFSHCPLEQIGRDAIVVAPVARSRDALDESALLEETGIDAGASFAGAELFGDLVEREVALCCEKQAEDSAGDPRQAIGFLGDGEPLDEILASTSRARCGRAVLHCAGFVGCHYDMVRLVRIERT